MVRHALHQAFQRHFLLAAAPEDDRHDALVLVGLDFFVGSSPLALHGLHLLGALVARLEVLGELLALAEGCGFCRLLGAARGVRGCGKVHRLGPRRSERVVALLCAIAALLKQLRVVALVLALVVLFENGQRVGLGFFLARDYLGRGLAGVGCCPTS